MGAGGSSGRLDGAVIGWEWHFLSLSLSLPSSLRWLAPVEEGGGGGGGGSDGQDVFWFRPHISNIFYVF